MLKILIDLFVPKILKRSFWISQIDKLSQKDKFKYEQTYYKRHAFILRSLSKFDINQVNYLEIGTEYNQVFSTIHLKEGFKIGVDPNNGGTERITSDEFFKINKMSFNVIFIDGLHSYEQTKRDCLNSMKVLKKNGIILLHDLLPKNLYESRIYRSGDSWKVGVELSKSKNLDFRIVNIDKGVGILKLKENYKYFHLEDIENQNFNDFINLYYNELPIINSREAINFIDKN